MEPQQGGLKDRTMKEGGRGNLAVTLDVDELDTLHFDPWLTCKGGALRRLADEIFEGLPFPSPLRRKAPRVDVTNRRRRCVHAIVANVISMMLSPASHDALATPLRNPTASRTRYEYSGYSVQVLTATITTMRKAGFLFVIKGAQHRHRTRILPSFMLSEMLAAVSVDLQAVGREAGAETIRGISARREAAGGRTVLEVWRNSAYAP